LPYFMMTGATIATPNGSAGRADAGIFFVPDVALRGVPARAADSTGQCGADQPLAADLVPAQIVAVGAAVLRISAGRLASSQLRTS
jgi:hypothetical protein